MNNVQVNIFDPYHHLMMGNNSCDQSQGEAEPGLTAVFKDPCHKVKRLDPISGSLPERSGSLTERRGIISYRIKILDNDQIKLQCNDDLFSILPG